jgi:hypothetical protein
MAAKPCEGRAGELQAMEIGPGRTEGVGRGSRAGKRLPASATQTLIGDVVLDNVLECRYDS